jgi:phosphoribosylaminoimidazole carboxylase PurE protein
MSKTVLKPRVAILMGSDSDLAVMSHAAKILERFDVAYELEITSAHRSPERTVEIVRRAQESGTEVFIVGAGGAAHLAGVVAAHTHRPVLGVPLASSDLAGLDALLATVQMPGGVPVGTLAIGAAGATNAALLACAILALSDPGLGERLVAHRREMAASVESKSKAAKAGLRSLLDPQVAGRKEG